MKKKIVLVLIGEERGKDKINKNLKTGIKIILSHLGIKNIIN